MDVVFVLLPLALLVAGLMLGFFIWAVRSGQYDDLETPAVRILLDDEEAGGGKGRRPAAHGSGATNDTPAESDQAPAENEPFKRN